MKTNSNYWRAGPYAALAISCLAGEIWLAWEKLSTDGVQSWALFVIIPAIAIAAAVLIHMAVEDLTSWSWRILRAPFAAALAMIGLLVALPASISSSGSARDAAVNQAEAANTVVDDARAEAERLKGKLKWAEQDRDATCKKFGKDSRKCLSANDTVNSYTDRRTKALEQVKDTPVKVEAAGEKRLAWAAQQIGFPIAEQDIANGLPMVTSLALALMGPFFGAAALAELRRTRSPATIAGSDIDWPHLPSPSMFSGELPEPTPPRGPRKRKTLPENVLTFPAKHPVLCALETAGGSVASNRELARLMKVSDGEASKRWQEVQDHLSVSRQGRHLQIALR